MSCENEVRTYRQRRLALAAELFAAGETPPDPITVQRTAEAVLNEIDRMPPEERAVVLPLDADGKVLWTDLIVVHRDDLYTVKTRPGARMAPHQSEQLVGIAAAMALVDEELRRLRRAVDGNGSLKALAARVRDHLFGGRTLVRSKAGYEHEVRMILAAIRSLLNPPPAVLAMVPRLEAALARLDGTLPAPGGRPAAVPDWTWSPEVQQAAMALQIVLGDFLSWAAATATERRLAAFTRIIMPQRRTDPAKGAPEPQEEPAQGSGTAQAEDPATAASDSATAPAEASTPAPPPSEVASTQPPSSAEQPAERVQELPPTGS